MSSKQDKDKKVVGLYGEMRLAMELHARGWQVYRAYIDEKFDFVIMKCYCRDCGDFAEAHIREEPYGTKLAKCVTNLCNKCHKDTLQMIVRFIQVKTSEGVSGGKNPDIKNFSFHAKIRYHLSDYRMFYVWIAKTDNDNVHFYVFKPDDVARFDDLSLASYQTTDNQKTTLRIDDKGAVHNKAQKVEGQSAKDYGAFEAFLNNFDAFETICDGDEVPGDD